jgi:hypothetical protein
MNSDASSLRLTLNVSLKTEEDIEAAVKFFNIQYSGQVGTQRQNIDTLKAYGCPILIEQKN